MVVFPLESLRARVLTVAALATPVPVGVPFRTGVAIVGLVPNTAAPLPVSSVRAAAKFAELGVASHVATPVPNPLTPVLIGNPVQLVRVPEAGMPSAGVVRVGEVAYTGCPVPVFPDAVPNGSAGISTQTNVLPVKFTAEPPLLDAFTVVRVSVFAPVA